jgi:lysine 2,3-aminomutase
MSTLRRPRELIAAGLAPEGDAARLDAVARRYAIAITPAMAALIDRADRADPIARQFVPDAAELIDDPAELPDPIGDARWSPVRGIVHRYPDRVLLKPLHACPVYCRFCFRREQVGPGGDALDDAELAAALDYIRAHQAIREVILTGGDPLMLAPRRMQGLIAGLAAIEHVETLRVHSRVPVVDPGRVTSALVRALASGGDKPTWLAVHANHAREFTEETRAACRRLSAAGIPLLGQTVLLKGVNADAATLEALFRAMLRARIKPYYLHHPDLARGTARFRVTIAEGRALMRDLRGRVSGLAQPTYVLDIPGGEGKVPIGPDYLASSEDGWIVEDPNGARHRYPEAAER